MTVVFFFSTGPKKKSMTKSSAKEQSLRDYAGVITLYAVIVTILVIFLGARVWFGMNLWDMIMNLFKKAE